MALGVSGTLLGLVPYLTRGEVRGLLLLLCAANYVGTAVSYLPFPSHTHYCASSSPQRKRLILDQWAESMYNRDAQIKKLFS